MFAPNSIAINKTFAQYPIANPIKNSLNRIIVNSGTEVGATNWILDWINGKTKKVIAALSHIFNCCGIGNVENIGADINIPFRRVNIAIKRIIFAGENMSNRLYIMLLIILAEYL